MKRLNIIIICGIVGMFLVLLNCDSFNSSKKIADYYKLTQELEKIKGEIRFIDSPDTMDLYHLKNGNDLIFIYERTGVTHFDYIDWDIKFKENLIFRIDSTFGEFEFCDSSLSKIDCRYYRIYYTKQFIKESGILRSGCINGLIVKDSISMRISVQPKDVIGNFEDKKNFKPIGIQKVWHKYKIKTKPI